MRAVERGSDASDAAGNPTDNTPTRVTPAAGFAEKITWVRPHFAGIMSHAEKKKGHPVTRNSRSEAKQATHKNPVSFFSQRNFLATTRAGSARPKCEGPIIL
jgi:hypothetical protein